MTYARLALRSLLAVSASSMALASAPALAQDATVIEELVVTG